MKYNRRLCNTELGTGIGASLGFPVICDLLIYCVHVDRRADGFTLNDNVPSLRCFSEVLSFYSFVAVKFNEDLNKYMLTHE